MLLNCWIYFKGPLSSQTRNRYLLVVDDEFSRFPLTYPCQDFPSQSVIVFLKKYFVFSIFLATFIPIVFVKIIKQIWASKHYMEDYRISNENLENKSTKLGNSFARCPNSICSCCVPLITQLFMNVCSNICVILPIGHQLHHDYLHQVLFS